MREYFRFPHTPHLAWLGPGRPRDDKILAPEQTTALLAGPVVVEEKVDGANIGLSTTAGGELCVQNRGSYLRPDTAHPQFRSLWSWLSPRESRLVDTLWPDMILFGEWCVAVHSVEYDRLPDWFLGFDVYDRGSGAFWDTARRNNWLSELGLEPTPRLAEGVFTLDELRGLLEGSCVGSGTMEGLIVRKEAVGCTRARAKLVRAEFTQAIDEHWSRAPMRRNRLAQEAMDQSKSMGSVPSETRRAR